MDLQLLGDVSSKARLFDEGLRNYLKSHKEISCDVLSVVDLPVLALSDDWTDSEVFPLKNLGLI